MFKVNIVHDSNCVVPENIHPPHQKVNGNSEWEGGLIDGNSRGVGGCSYEEFLRRVRKFTKKS